MSEQARPTASSKSHRQFGPSVGRSAAQTIRLCLSECLPVKTPLGQALRSSVAASAAIGSQWTAETQLCAGSGRQAPETVRVGDAWPLRLASAKTVCVTLALARGGR